MLKEKSHKTGSDSLPPNFLRRLFGPPKKLGSNMVVALAAACRPIPNEIGCTASGTIDVKCKEGASVRAGREE